MKHGGIALLLLALLAAPLYAISFVSGLTTSGTLTISSSNPSATVSTSGTASWNILLAILSNSWTLHLQAAAASFTGCATVPLSTVTVTCNSIVDTGLIGGSRACAAPFTLSTTNQLVASGSDPLGVAGSRTVTIQFTFADSWKYQGTSSPCSVSLNYSLDAF
jgi:hypothetical protein